MDNFRKSLDDGIKRIRGKIELVKKPHVSVKQWLESNISMSIISSKTGSGERCSSTTSGPSTCSASDSHHVVQTIDMPSKPSRFMAMNVELQDIFEDDDSERMTEVLEKGLDPNFIDLNGKPLVYRAVEEQKYCILDTMLEFGFGCDVNSTCHNEINGGWTALHLACHLGDFRAVEILLGVTDGRMNRLECCDISAVDIDGRTPLHVLAASSSWYYQHPCHHGNQPEPSLSRHHSANHTLPAVHSGCDIGCAYTNLGMMLQNGGDGPGIQPRMAGESSDSLDEGGEDFIGLTYQARIDEHQNAAVLSRMLNGGDLKTCSTKNNNPIYKHAPVDLGNDLNTSNNVMITAANHISESEGQKSHLKLTGRTLVSQSQKICHQTNRQRGDSKRHVNPQSRVHKAVDNKQATVMGKTWEVSEDPLAVTPHGKIMKILLKAGSNANRVDEYNGTPLHICALRGNLEGVSILLEHGADYDLVDNMCETALVKAIIHHRSSVVKRLLVYQTSLSDMNRLELSELIFALIEDLSGKEELQQEQEVLAIIQSLIDKRVVVHVTDSRGRTPLHLSVLYGCELVARELIHLPGCLIDKQDEDGFSPLFLAAWNPKKVEQPTQLRLLELLLQRGAKVNQHDVCKILPVNAALESGQYSNVLLLIQHGCYVNSQRWFCYSVEMLRQNTSTLPFVERFVLSMINNYRYSPSLLDVAAILGKKELVKAIFKAGPADVNISVMQRWVANETQEFAVMDLQGYVDFLQEVAAQVLSLKDLTRRAIRTALGTQIYHKTKHLPLPDSIQSYVKMEEVKL